MLPRLPARTEDPAPCGAQTTRPIVSPHCPCLSSRGPRPGTRRAHPPNMDNSEIADTLEELADLLAHSGANPFRVRAYRQGADTVRHLGRPAAAILAKRPAWVGTPGEHWLRPGRCHRAGADRQPPLGWLRAESRRNASLPGIGRAGATHPRGRWASPWTNWRRPPGRAPGADRGVGRATAGAGARRPAGAAGPPRRGCQAAVLETRRGPQYREQAATGRLFKLAPGATTQGRAWLPSCTRGAATALRPSSRTRGWPTSGQDGRVGRLSMPAGQEGQAHVVSGQGDLAVCAWCADVAGRGITSRHGRGAV